MKNIVQNIIIVLFFIVFSYFYWEDFLNFHQNKNELLEEKKDIQNNVENFSFEQIRDYENIELFSSSEKDLSKRIIEKIKSAEIRVYIEVYMLTHTKIINALKAKKKEWIDVKIILEKNPYNSPRLNDKAFNGLIEAWLDVVWSNPKNYSLNHSKMLLIDNEIILSTWNLSFSTFSRNQDLFLLINDKLLLENLEKIFLNDFAWIRTWKYDTNLVLSPDYSREKLNYLITNSKKSLKIYFPYLKDDLFEEKIITKSLEWIDVKAVVSEKFYKEEK